MSANPPPRENPLVNLVCNLVLPTIVLMKFSGDRWLGPFWGLLVALSFPLGYGIYDFVRRRKTNLLSILGFISVLLSGGLALAKVGGFWFAVKESLLPAVIGLAVLLSLRTRRPLVRELIYNDALIDVPRVEAALAERGHREAFEGLLRRASIGLACTFLASAPANYLLALRILQSPPGTEAFNAELARMNWLSMLVIALPSTVALMVVFWRLLDGLGRLTGLTHEEIFRDGKR